MLPLTPRSTRTDTRFPDTTLFRSIRESRRIIGDYVLTADDLIRGRSFSDGVAMGGYHIDIHRPSGSWVDSKNVLAYTIPLRSLIASKVEGRSEEHTSELQSLMRLSYAVFCLKKKTKTQAYIT